VVAQSILGKGGGRSVPELHKRVTTQRKAAGKKYVEQRRVMEGMQSVGGCQNRRPGNDGKRL